MIATIRTAAEAAGMGRLTDGTIDTFVRKLHNIVRCRPSKMVDGRCKQDNGYKMLILCEDGFDEKAERVRRMEEVRQSVRSRVTTHDRFTPTRELESRQSSNTNRV